MILIDKHPLTIIVCNRADKTLIVGNGADKLIEVICEYHRKRGCVVDCTMAKSIGELSSMVYAALSTTYSAISLIRICDVDEGVIREYHNMMRNRFPWIKMLFTVDKLDGDFRDIANVVYIN